MYVCMYMYVCNLVKYKVFAHQYFSLFVLQTIIRCDPHIGLLHRGTEKLMEYKTYMQVSSSYVLVYTYSIYHSLGINFDILIYVISNCDFPSMIQQNLCMLVLHAFIQTTHLCTLHPSIEQHPYKDASLIRTTCVVLNIRIVCTFWNKDSSLSGTLFLFQCV